MVPSTDLPERPRQPLDGYDEVILLIDDERTVRESLKAVLTRRRYHVVAAANGREGLALLAEGNPPIDVMMTDMMMPLMDGLRVIAEARALRPNLPIIAISGIRDYREKVAAFPAPPVLFMSKPFFLDALLGTIREALQGASGATGTGG